MSRFQIAELLFHHHFVLPIYHLARHYLLHYTGRFGLVLHHGITGHRHFLLAGNSHNQNALLYFAKFSSFSVWAACGSTAIVRGSL